MSKLSRKIKDFAKSFDLFSEPITLRLYEKKRFTTLVGSFFSISMLSLVLILSFAKFDSMYNRKNVTVESYYQIESFSPLISLKNRFAISLKPYNFNSLSGKRYFDFLFLLGKVDFYPNGTSVKTKTVFNFTYCKFHDFPMFSPEQLKIFGIESWICPNFDQNLDVMGNYEQELYQYIQIGVLKCSNSSNQYSNDTCANDDEITALRKQNSTSGKIYLNLKIINNIFNVYDHENPITPMFEDLTYLFNYKDSYIQKEVYFSKIRLETDETRTFNFLRSSDGYKYDNSFIFDRKVDEFSLNENVISNNNIMYSSIFLRSDAKTLNMKRKYDTFEDFLQTFGSLYSFFFIIFKILSQYFTYDYMTQKIANSLYSFTHLSLFAKKSNVKKINNSTKNFQDISYFSKFKNNFLMKLKEILWRKNKKKKDEYTVKEINDTIIKDMDLIQILHKMKQLENLKSILLDKNQKMLLDFMAKPKFKIDTSNMTKRQMVKEIENSTKITSSGSVRIYNNVLKAYNYISKENNHPINNKILELVDKDLIKKINSGRMTYKKIKF